MNNCMKCGQGTKPEVENIERSAYRNQNYRKEFWTGEYLQMTLMSIPIRGEIGVEIHEDTDQYIRVEQGRAIAIYGECRNHLDSKSEMSCGDGFFVPAGTWHNVINTGNIPLKLSSVYAPPHHPKGTVQKTKEEAERDSHKY